MIMLVNLFIVLILPMVAFGFITYLLIMLQSHLSGMRSRIPGLILPILSFLIGLVVSLVLWSLDGETNTEFFWVLCSCAISRLSFIYWYISIFAERNLKKLSIDMEFTMS